MTRPLHPTVSQEVVQLLADHGFEGLSQTLELLFNEVMKLERQQVLDAAPYERCPERRGHANGFKPKTVHSRVGDLHLEVPQTRGVPFYPQSLERGQRSEKALKLAIAEMYVQGVSTRKVEAITRELCGLDVSSTQVSRLAQQMDAELDAWRRRPLDAVQYLILDARYEKVRYGGSVVDCAVLTAVGVLPDGHRTILGVSVSLSEAEIHWRTFLQSLIERGLHGVKLIVSDSHLGLTQARKACFPGVPWQRCQFHLARNAVQYVPREEQREEVAQDLQLVFDAPDQASAQRQLEQTVKKYASTAPRLAAWLEENVPEALTIFQIPVGHRRRLRTTNAVERLNREIKRRTRVATLFPNENAALRLVTAVLIEISEDWETGKRYLSPETK